MSKAKTVYLVQRSPQSRQDRWETVAVVESLKDFESWFKRNHPAAVVQERVKLGHKHCRRMKKPYTPFVIRFYDTQVPDCPQHQSPQQLQPVRFAVKQYGRRHKTA